MAPWLGATMPSYNPSGAIAEETVDSQLYTELLLWALKAGSAAETHTPEHLSQEVE